MGNAWKGTTDEKLVAAEEGLLAYSGVPRDRLFCQNVFLDEEGSPGFDPERYIHHVEVRPEREPKPAIVLVHGYGIGSALFYPVLADLSKHFHVFAIDLLGMGSSGRPNFDPSQSAESAESFFIFSIKQWKERVGLGKFYLTGHSLGGYLSVCYALEFPEDVLELLLLSPVGVPHKPEEYSPEKIAERQQSRSGKMFVKTVYSFWERGYSPYSFLRASGRFAAPMLLKSYLKRRMMEGSTKDKQELNALVGYLAQIQMRPGSSEYAIHCLLDVGAWAKNPLIDRLPILGTDGLKVHFFYGEFDWMDASPAMQLVNQQLLPGSVNVVRNADHHLFLNKENDLVYKMLLALFGEEAAVKHLEVKAAEAELKN